MSTTELTAVEDLINKITDPKTKKQSRVKAIRELQTILKSLKAEAIQTGDAVTSALDNNIKGSKEATKAMKDFMQGTEQMGQSVGATAKALSTLNAAIDKNIKTIKSFHGTTKQFGDYIVNIASGISSLTMGINALSSIGSVITNDDLSSWEKFIQILLSASMGIPMVFSGLAKLKETINGISIALELTAVKYATLEQVKQKNLNSNVAQMLIKEIAIRKIDIATLGEEAVQQELIDNLKAKGVVLDEVKIKRIIEEITAQQALNLAQKSAILTEYGLTAATQALSAALKKAAVAAGAFMASFGWLIAGAAAIAGAIGLYKALQKNQEESDKQAIKTAQYHKELTDALVAERDELRQLSDEYHKLDSTSSNYQSQVIELMQTHKNQEGVVLALTGQYAKLNEVLKEQEKIKNDSILSSAKIDKINSQKAIVGGLRQAVKDAGGDIDNNGKTIDLSGFDVKDKREKALKKQLEELLGEDAFVGAWGHLNIVSLAEGLTTDADAVKQILKEFSDTEAATELIKYIEEINDLLEDYNDTISNISEIGLQNIFDTNFNITSFDASTYVDLIEKVQQQAYTQGLDLTEQEINEWVRRKIQAIDEVAEYAKAADIAQLIINKGNFEKTEKELDALLNTFTEQIAKFNESDQAYIALHPYWALEWLTASTSRNVDFDKISQSIANQSRYLNSKNNVNSALGIIQNVGNDKKGEISDDDRTAAYGLLGLVEGSLTDEELLDKLTDFYTSAITETNTFFETAYTEAESYVNGLKDDLIQLEKDISAEEQEILNNAYGENVLEHINTKLSETGFNSLAEAINAYIDSGDNVDEKLANFINSTLRNNSKVFEGMDDATYKAYLKRIANLEKETNNYNNLIVEGLNNLNNIEKQTIDYTSIIKRHQAAIEGLNASIDSLQGAYKTITSAQQEYAETGYYSVDSIQSLLDLGPEYLQYLHIENDEIILHTEEVKAQQHEYYNLLETKYANLLLTQKELLLDAEAAPEEKAKIQRLYQEVILNNALGTSLSLVETELRAAASAGGEYSETLKNMADYANNLADIFDLAHRSIELDFDGAFGDSKLGSLKDYEKYTTELADRYHDLNEAIEKTAHSMTMLEKIQDRLSGANLIASLKEQNKLIEQQQKQYKALGKELRTEQLELQSDQRLGQFGAKFNKDGTIANYADVFTTIEDQYFAAVEKYNESVHKYNNMSKDAQKSQGDQMLKDAKNELDAAKEFHDKAQDWLERSDEVAAELRDLEEKYIEQQLKKIDNNFKRFETKFQLKFDIADAKKALLGFLRTTQKDFTKVFSSRSDKIGNFNSYKAESRLDLQKVNASAQKVNDIRAVIDNENYEYGGDNALFATRDEAIQKYLEASQELMDNGEELYNLYETAYNDYLSAIDEVTDQWNDVINGFDRINDTLDHYQKIAEMLYDANSQAGMQTIDKIYGAAANNSLLKQEALRKEIDALQKEKAQIGGDENNQDIKKITDAIHEAESQLQSEIENYLSTIQNKLVNSIHQIMDSANKQITGGFGLDTISERWEDAQAAAEDYYDEVERVYQLEKLENSWNDALKDAKTIKSQQQIKTIMDAQLKNLEEKTELSKYDISLAEKELEITKAQMAFEDARNNKNTMKLVRNEQGNWAYQYVADTDDVADKEQKVLDLLYDKYNFVKQASEDATEDLLNLQQTAQERLTSLMEEYKYADEERRTKIKEEYDYLSNYYYGEDGIIVKKSKEAAEIQKDLNIAGMETLWGLYTQDEENFDKMTKKQQDLIEDLRKQGISSFADLAAQVATDDGSFYNKIYNKAHDVITETQSEWGTLASNIVASWSTDTNSVKNVMESAYYDIMVKVGEYDSAIASSEEKSGTAWGNIKNSIDANITALADEQNGLIAKVNKLTSKTKDLSTFRKKVDKIKASWDEAKTSITNATSELNKYLGLLTEQTDHTISVHFDVDQLDLNIPESKTVKIKYDDGNGTDGGGIKDVKTTYSIVNSIGGTAVNKKTYSSKNDAYNAAEMMVDDKNKNAGKVVDYLNNYAIVDSYGRVVEGTVKHGIRGKDTKIIVRDDFSSKEAAQKYIDSVKKPANYKNIMEAFGTGGYTGSWGDSGKLGVLHEKELVLNQEDTANILSAVAAVRSIAGLGSSISNIVTNGLNNMMASIGSIKPATASSSQTINNGGNNTFNIHAEFPNANDVNEIREAILSLPTLASQYLSQNNK